MTTSVEERALKLLGDGFAAEIVANSIGVSASRISQLMSDAGFSEKVAERRFKSLSKHSERDEKYDSMEDTLIDRFERCLPLMYKPMEVLKALREINGIKRKGVSNPAAITNQQEVISLILPTMLVQQFTMNVHNQVVKIGEQDLVTIQSGSMNDLLENKHVSILEDRISSSESRISSARERAGVGPSTQSAENA
jgi:hypothetical protein